MKKRLFAALIAALMLASAAFVNVSAEIRLVDHFDAWVKGGFWYGSSENPGGQKSFINEINGNNVLVSPPEARIHQGDFTSSEEGVGFGEGRGTITTGTFWVTLYTTIVDNDDCGAGLWWRNTYYQIEDGAEMADTFTVKYYPGDSSVVFRHQSPTIEKEEQEVVVRWTDPKQRGENANNMIPLVLGFRVERGKISAFVDGKCIGSYEDPTIGTKPCPVLLWNDGLRVYWEDFTVGDLVELSLNSTVPGDVNGDGDVNAKDIIFIMRFMIDRKNPPMNFNEQAADFNGDGDVNAKDIILIMRKMIADHNS